MDTNNWRKDFDNELGINLSHFPDESIRDHFRMWLSGFLSDSTRYRWLSLRWRIARHSAVRHTASL